MNHIFPIGLDTHHRSAVRAILELGQRARRRCPCQHILSYSTVELHSSVELYICKICGASHCKSCKGSPEHALARSQDSLEDLKALPYAQAQFEFWRCFPQVLWMRSSTDALVRSLDNALLLASTCDNSQRGELGKTGTLLSHRIAVTTLADPPVKPRIQSQPGLGCALLGTEVPISRSGTAQRRLGQFCSAIKKSSAASFPQSNNGLLERSTAINSGRMGG